MGERDGEEVTTQPDEQEEEQPRTEPWPESVIEAIREQNRKAIAMQPDQPKDETWEIDQLRAEAAELKTSLGAKRGPLDTQNVPEEIRMLPWWQGFRVRYDRQAADLQAAREALRQLSIEPHTANCAIRSSANPCNCWKKIADKAYYSHLDAKDIPT